MAAEETLNALTHLFCRFIGEGDGENVPRCDAFFRNQVSDAMRNNACFARARTGENKKRPFCMKYGLALLFVELRKKIRFHYLINP